MLPSTNWTPKTPVSTDWKKNIVLVIVTAGDLVVTAGSLIIFATGYNSLNPNFIENIPSTDYQPTSVPSSNWQE